MTPDQSCVHDARTSVATSGLLGDAACRRTRPAGGHGLPPPATFENLTLATSTGGFCAAV